VRAPTLLEESQPELRVVRAASCPEIHLRGRSKGMVVRQEAYGELRPYLGAQTGESQAALTEVGVQAKPSFEDAIIPVWKARRRRGGRVGLLGGCEMDVLARGTEDGEIEC